MDLYEAARNGNLEHVRMLVEQGADKDKGDNNGCTPLYYASRDGHLDVVQYLVEQGASLDKASVGGWTPLIGARNGRLEIAMLLMSYGADLNARDKGGYLPIDMFGVTEEIKQAIRDEPRRRLDDAPGKRATEQDRHPNAVATSALAQQEGEEHSNKRPRLDDGAAAEEETKVAEEDEDSEPSSDGKDEDSGVRKIMG